MASDVQQTPFVKQLAANGEGAFITALVWSIIKLLVAFNIHFTSGFDLSLPILQGRSFPQSRLIEVPRYDHVLKTSSSYIPITLK